jgi:hypothetical protein
MAAISTTKSKMQSIVIDNIHYLRMMARSSDEDDEVIAAAPFVFDSLCFTTAAKLSSGTTAVCFSCNDELGCVTLGGVDFTLDCNLTWSGGRDLDLERFRFACFVVDVLFSLAGGRGVLSSVSIRPRRLRFLSAKDSTTILISIPTLRLGWM